MYEDIGKPTRVKSKTPPKKGKSGYIVILVLVLVMVGFAVVIGFNLFDFREGVIMSYLRNAPLIGSLIPAVAEDDYDDIPLEEWPPDMLVARIRELEQQVYALEAENLEHIAQARRAALRIARLSPFEEHWMEYQRVVAEFNTMIVHGDPEAYLLFISYILPEFYEQLARDAVSLYQYQSSVRSIVGSLRNMQERAAAGILEDMLITDLPLLTAVLMTMGDVMRGAILEQMESDVASQMLRLIRVPAPVLPPLGPALFTPVLPETYDDLHEEEEQEEQEENDDV